MVWCGVTPTQAHSTLKHSHAQAHTQIRHTQTLYAHTQTLCAHTQTLHTSHFILHTSHFTLHSSFTLTHSHSHSHTYTLTLTLTHSHTQTLTHALKGHSRRCRQGQDVPCHNTRGRIMSDVGEGKFRPDVECERPHPRIHRHGCRVETSSRCEVRACQEEMMSSHIYIYDEFSYIYLFLSIFVSGHLPKFLLRVPHTFQR